MEHETLEVSFRVSLVCFTLVMGHVCATRFDI